MTASPRAATERFVEQLGDFCAEHAVELIVPTWEEAFYLATQRERLEQVASLYTPAVRDARARARQALRSSSSSSGSASRSPTG